MLPSLQTYAGNCCAFSGHGNFCPILGYKVSNMVVSLVNRRMPGEGFSFYSCPGLSNLRFPVQPSALWQCILTALNTLKYFSPWASHFTSQLQENENRLPSWLGEIISSSCLHRNQVTMAKKGQRICGKTWLKRDKETRFMWLQHFYAAVPCVNLKSSSSRIW